MYGHWHSDKECPYYEETKKKKDKSAFITENEPGEGNHTAFVVGQASSEEDDDNDDDEAFLAHGTGLGQRCLREESIGLGLSDTCCAKTVAGQEWVATHVAKLKQRGLPYKDITEREPFRFGGGPKVFSSKALVFPLCIPGCKLPVLLRTSIVDQEVPLLISRSALQAMGMIMNLVDGSMKFEKLGCETALVTTSTGHVGFSIMAAETCHWGDKLDWSTVDREKEAEIFFVCESEGTTRLRTRALSDSHPSCDVFPEPRNHMRDISDVLEQCHLNQRECDRAAGLVNSRHGPSDSEQGSAEEEAGVHRSHPRIPEGHPGGGGLAVNVPGQAQGDLPDLEAKEGSWALAGGVETRHGRDAPQLLHREGSCLLPPGARQSLAGMDQEPIHFGDRDVRGRHHGGACPDWDLGGHDQRARPATRMFVAQWRQHAPTAAWRCCSARTV